MGHYSMFVSLFSIALKTSSEKKTSEYFVHERKLNESHILRPFLVVIVVLFASSRIRLRAFLSVVFAVGGRLHWSE
jgi:hypothetical protein